MPGAAGQRALDALFAGPDAQRARTHAFAWAPAGPLRGPGGLAAECVQRAGELMFLPQDWLHATLNEGVSIGVGGQMHSPGLHVAAGRNNVSLADSLCAPHGGGCAASPLNAPNSGQRTPMHSAADANAVEMLDWMLAQGFDDLGSYDSKRQLPIFLACVRGHVEAVRWFHTVGG